MNNKSNIAFVPRYHPFIFGVLHSKGKSTSRISYVFSRNEAIVSVERFVFRDCFSYIFRINIIESFDSRKFTSIFILFILLLNKQTLNQFNFTKIRKEKNKNLLKLGRKLLCTNVSLIQFEDLASIFFRLWLFKQLLVRLIFCEHFINPRKSQLFSDKWIDILKQHLSINLLATIIDNF